MRICRKINNVKHIVIIVLMVLLQQIQARSQSIDFKGQVSGWMTVNGDKVDASQMGLRYIPTLFLEKTLFKDFTLDTEISINTYSFGQWNGWDRMRTEGKTRSYRMWIRFSSSQFEARIGLQKINFGSATLLRPLMWFDRIDPRDPLQITDGVYGLLARYYFLNNTNIWLWGLYGNHETKGWEFIPSDKKKIEYGGRIQVPIYTGEIAFTFHHRKLDPEKSILGKLPLNWGTAPENRFAIDGKWDISVGFWFEGTFVHQDHDLLPYKYQHLMNVGLDYTFGLGNGLHVLYEYFRLEMTERAFSRGENFTFSALSLNYPAGLMDNFTGMIYYDWKNHDWYRFINWQRTYDNWSLYIIGFWNPDQFQIYQNLTENNLFAGKGFQFMIVMNH